MIEKLKKSHPICYNYKVSDTRKFKYNKLFALFRFKLTDQMFKKFLRDVDFHREYRIFYPHPSSREETLKRNSADVSIVYSKSITF